MVTIAIYIIAALAALFIAFTFGLGLGALHTIIRNRKFRKNVGKAEALNALAGEILLRGDSLNLHDVAVKLQARGGNLAIAGDHLEYALAKRIREPKEIARLLLSWADDLEPLMVVE